MYERLHVNAKVERSSTFALPLFYLARKIYLRAQVKIKQQWKSTLRAASILVSDVPSLAWG